MTRNTRYFMAGSAAILTAGLATGLVHYYTGGFQTLSAASIPNELAYVPADAAVIAYADVGAIMHSELRQRIKEAMPAQQQQGQEEFHRETGIDIERDIQYVVAAVTPGAGHSALLVARGNFNPTHLETLAIEHGGTAETYNGKRIVSRAGMHEGGDGTLAFLEPGLVAIGNTASVKRAIDARASATSVTSNDEIMTLVKQIELSHNAWAVGRVDVLTAQAKLPDQVARQIPPVKWFAAAGHINGGVSGMVRVEATDEEGGELLRRQVNGALAFGEMMARSDERAGAALRSLQVTGSGRSVEVSFTVPAELMNLVLPPVGQVGVSIEAH